MKNLINKAALFLAAVAFLAACSASKNLDRSVVPSAAPAPAISIGNYTTQTLDNGMKLIVVENHKIPRVRYRVFVDRGPIAEGDKAGALSMMGAIMASGTTSMSKAEIDEKVDFIGASLNAGSQGISGASLKKHSEELLSIMSDVLLNPSFPQEELEKTRKQLLSNLANAKTDANTISSNITAVMTYGKEHPYGEIETEKSIESITREDLLAYYQSSFKPNASYMVVVGDITPEEAVAQANKYFGKWKKDDSFTKKDFKKPTSPKANRVAFVPVDGAVQSVINLTYPVDYKLTSDDYVAARVMNSILGGGIFSGRLMMNLREDKAFTYGARSSLSASSVMGDFSAGASVRNEVTDSALVEFIYEIERMTTELVPDSTLDFVKNGMNGQFALGLESPETVAQFALNIERYGLPSDFYDGYLARLAAVTKEDVLAAAKKYLKPDNMWITVVGNKEVVPSIARFAADQNVEMYDMYGNPWQDMQAAPEDVSVESVIAKYYEAIGGLEKVKAIKTLKQEGTFNMQGMPLEMTILMKGNEKMALELKMQGQVAMERKFDGKTGYNMQMGQKAAFSEEEIFTAQQEADLLFEMNASNYGYSSKILGIEEVDGEQSYVIEMTDKDGLTSKDYYSVESGLKLQSTSIVESAMGPLNQIETIQEYVETDGILFPVKTTQQVGPQLIEISIEKVEVNKTISDSSFK